MAKVRMLRLTSGLVRGHTVEFTSPGQDVQGVKVTLSWEAFQRLETPTAIEVLALPDDDDEA